MPSLTIRSNLRRLRLKVATSLQYRAISRGASDPHHPDIAAPRGSDAKATDIITMNGLDAMQKQRDQARADLAEAVGKMARLNAIASKICGEYPVNQTLRDLILASVDADWVLAKHKGAE